MKVQSSVRARLCGVAFLIALAAGCGGGGGGGGGGEVDPPAPLQPPASPPAAEVRGWINPFGSAAVVLGQTGFDQLDPQGTTATPIAFPTGAVAVSDGRLFVGTSNDQLLVFSQYEASGPAALFSIHMPLVSSISAQGPKLVVASLHRVHIFNSAPDDDQDLPNVSAGADAPGCNAISLRQPGAAFLTRLGQLIVADSFNHRVLIWDAIPEQEPLGEPTVVLGQRHMETCVANDDDGNGVTDDSAGSRSMSFPTSVWSDGVRLVVADTGNNRVLIWDTFPNAIDENSQMAHHVLGQEGFDGAERNRGLPEAQATTLNRPSSVDVSAAGELAVADTGNNRVLIWRSIPGTDMKAADYVVGQADFTHSAENDSEQSGQDGVVPSAKTLSAPSGVRFDGRKLIVSDSGNSRVLVWRESD